MDRNIQQGMRCALTHFFGSLQKCCSKELLYGSYNLKEELGNEISKMNEEFQRIFHSRGYNTIPIYTSVFSVGEIRLSYEWLGPPMRGFNIVGLIQDKEKLSIVEQRVETIRILGMLSRFDYSNINNYTKLIKTFPFFEKLIQNNTNKILTSEVKGFVVDIPENYIEIARKEFNYHTLVNNFVYEIDSTFRKINCTYKNMEKE